MKAAVSATARGPEGLTFEEVADPVAGANEVVIAVRATALNRADLLQTLGRYPAPAGVPRDIPGLEHAGEVLSTGAHVTRWKAGDRVMGLVGGGAWAERLVAHEAELVPMPKGFAFADAAAIPEAFATAWDALVTQGGMVKGTRVLVHAVASGVGTAAVQLCRWQGAPVVGTGRSAAKLERAKAVGLERSVLVTEGAFAAEVKQHFDGRGVDLALDLVGGSWFPETLEAMAPRGTVMLVGLVAGASAKVSLATILSKRLRVQGTTLRSRGLEEKIAVARELERLVPAFERGELRPVIDEVLPMRELPAALQRLANNATFGKLVLTW